MTILPWILFTAAVVWFFASQHLNHRKRRQLENYIVYLLLNDEIREAHKLDFKQWIARQTAPNALALSLAAARALDDLAERLAIGDPSDPSTSSIMGAHAMIWNLKTEPEIDGI